MWEKLSWKKSVLVRSKILGLFVNTLTAEYMYSGRNMQTFMQQVQSQYADFHATSSDAIIFQIKDFFWNFYCLSEIYMKWRTFSRKKRRVI